MKIIALYLPQYHSIKENDEWYGKGYTEWEKLKEAKPLFEGHNQPRVPLNKNYYNLMDDSVKEWQCQIAKENGIYGFCFYHYWFNGHMLLEKPVEQFLDDKKCSLHFCICWANENWTNAWASAQSSTLIAQKYGDKNEWEEHFKYLLPFFKDKRYIKENGKPLLVIYRPELINDLNEMLDFWSGLAKKNGFNGIDFAYQNINFELIKSKDDSRFTYAIESQPSYGINELYGPDNNFLKKVKNKVDLATEKMFGWKLNIHRLPGLKLKITKYDDVWNAILKRIPPSDKYIPGAFVDWDNTPRWGDAGSIINGANPDKFEKYFTELIKKAKNEYYKDMIFVFAWNEWTEGGYLEPDEKYGYGYLRAVKNALIKTGEYPEE